MKDETKGTSLFLFKTADRITATLLSNQEMKPTLISETAEKKDRYSEWLFKVLTHKTLHQSDKACHGQKLKKEKKVVC